VSHSQAAETRRPSASNAEGTSQTGRLHSASAFLHFAFCIDSESFFSILLNRFDMYHAALSSDAKSAEKLHEAFGIHIASLSK